MLSLPASQGKRSMVICFFHVQFPSHRFTLSTPTFQSGLGYILESAETRLRWVSALNEAETWPSLLYSGWVLIMLDRNKNKNLKKILKLKPFPYLFRSPVLKFTFKTEKYRPWSSDHLSSLQSENHIVQLLSRWKGSVKDQISRLYSSFFISTEMGSNFWVSKFITDDKVPRGGVPLVEKFFSKRFLQVMGSG